MPPVACSGVLASLAERQQRADQHQQEEQDATADVVRLPERAGLGDVGAAGGQRREQEGHGRYLTGAPTLPGTPPQCPNSIPTPASTSQNRMVRPATTVMTKIVKFIRSVPASTAMTAS